MFSLIRVRDQLSAVADLYEAPKGTQAKKIARAPDGIPT